HDLPLRDLEELAAARVGGILEDDTDALADAHGIGVLSDDVARDQNPRRIRDRDEDDRVRHAIAEHWMHRLRDHRNARDATVSSAHEAAELEVLTGLAHIIGRMLDVLAALALLQRQHPGGEEVPVERVERRQDPVVAENAFHSGAPNNTALPGQ